MWGKVLDRHAFIHVSAGVPGGQPPTAGGELSPTVLLAEGIRQRLQGLAPVIGVGKIRTPTTARKILAEGMAGLVAVGRGLLTDPEWLEKARTGREDEIHQCHGFRGCQHHAGGCPAWR
ncbi:MAG: hypothetical protein AB1331_06395 [Bacillota bacterium]